MTRPVGRARAREHLTEAVACTECQAINPHGGAFCIECGAVLRASQTLQEREESARARHEATAALKHKYRWIAGITWLYGAGALSYAVVTVVAVLALARPEVPLGAGILVVALTTVLTALMLMGAIQILFKPFVWTSILAALASAVSAVHLIGPDPLGLMFFWSAAWAALFWAALVPTLRYRRLIAQYTDEYILHHASFRTRRSLRGRSAEERHARLLGVMQKAARRAWKISAVAAGSILLASALGTYGVLSNLRPEELSVALERFEAAWNDGDLAAVGALFPSNVRERQTTWLEGVTEGHGWREALPRLADGEIRRAEDRVWVDYELDDFTLSTCWILNGRSWVLFRVELPVPPLEPVFEGFLQAWRRSDLRAIADLFVAGHRDRMHEYIVRSARNRSWDTLPEILETHRTGSAEGEAVVTLSVEGGVVTTKWLFRADGRWGLHGLQFPRR